MDRFTTGHRIDAVDPGDIRLLPAAPGPGGSVLVEGVVARPGIYEYPQADGSVRRELVRVQDLWHQDSISTLARTPVTIEHPPEMITPDNVRQYSHGDVAEEIVEAAGGFVKIRMALRTREAQDAAAAGKLQLSPGYKVDCLEAPGTDPVFGDYDAIQVSRTYNHTAMTDRGRGGNAMSYRIDSAGAPVLIGKLASQETPPMDQLNSARDFVTRMDSLKAQRDVLVDARADGVSERLGAEKAAWDVWDGLYGAHDALLAEVQKALALEDDGDIRSALSEISADFGSVVNELIDGFASAVTAGVSSLRMDAVPPIPPKEEEEKPPAAPAATPPAPAPEGETPAAPPPPEGEAPAVPPEGGEAAAVPPDGTTAEPSAEGEGEQVPDSEGDPAVPPPTAPPAVAAPPTPDVPPALGQPITNTQLQGGLDNVLERIASLLAPLLLLFPQGGELGRLDSGVEKWEALADAVKSSMERVDTEMAQARLDSVQGDGLRYQIMRTRLDSVARDLSMDYDGVSLADLSRSVVAKLRPEIHFDSDADYIAAAQVLQIAPAATLPATRLDASIPRPTPVRSTYGPSRD